MLFIINHIWSELIKDHNRAYIKKHEQIVKKYSPYTGCIY